MTTKVVKTIFTVDASQAYAEADRLERRFAEVERNTQQAASGGSRSPLSPDLGGRLQDLASQRLRNSFVDFFITSYAATVTELAPRVREMREDQEKIAGLIERVTGSSKEAAGAWAALGAKVGLTTTALGSIAAISAAGLAAIGVAYKITTEIRDEAQRRLTLEERLAAVYGEQSKKMFDIREQYRLAVLEQEKGFALAKQMESLQGASRERLLDRLKTVETLANAAPDGTNAENYRKEALAIRQLVNELDKRNAAEVANRGDASFEARNELFKSGQEQIRRLEKEREEKLKKDLETGKEKIKDYSRTVKELFRSMAMAATDNPFVSVFVAASDRIKQTREQTKGLNADLRKTFEDLARQQNRMDLFNTRLNTQVEVQDLKTRAEDFRRYDPNFTPEARRRTLTAETNQRLRYPDSVNVDAIIQRYFDGINMIYQTERWERERRLDDQIRLLERTPVQSDRERAEVNRRLVSLLGSMNPEDLSKSQRETAAKALETEAANKLRLEQEAHDYMGKQLEEQKAIKSSLDALLKHLQQNGLKSLEAKINVSDSTANGIETEVRPTRPTLQDVGLAYGPGGLTNR